MVTSPLHYSQRELTCCRPPPDARMTSDWCGDKWWSWQISPDAILCPTSDQLSVFGPVKLQPPPILCTGPLVITLVGPLFKKLDLFSVDASTSSEKSASTAIAAASVVVFIIAVVVSIVPSSYLLHMHAAIIAPFLDASHYLPAFCSSTSLSFGLCSGNCRNYRSNTYLHQVIKAVTK